MTTANDSSATRSRPYKPVARVPNKRDLAIARVEFDRREAALEDVHENERDVQVVLATGVKLFEWMESAMANQSQGFTFEAVVEEGVKADEVNPDTKCDIVMVKRSDLFRKRALSMVSSGFHSIKNTNNLPFRASGGMELFTIDAAGNASLRDPDLCFAKIGGHKPTLIAEVEERHRSVLSLDQWCRGYFHTPGVRLVLGFKLYPANLDGDVAALVLQYGYTSGNQVEIMDAVSFGMRDVEPQGIPDDIWSRIRFLPHPTRAQMESCLGPWTPDDHGFLTLPRAECLYGTPADVLNSPA
ncbi:hypothetical protein LEN26_004044, partial [Aphanomyces euteiches]